MYNRRVLSPDPRGALIFAILWLPVGLPYIISGFQYGFRPYSILAPLTVFVLFLGIVMSYKIVYDSANIIYYGLGKRTVIPIRKVINFSGYEVNIEGGNYKGLPNVFTFLLNDGTEIGIQIKPFRDKDIVELVKFLRIMVKNNSPKDNSSGITKYGRNT